MIVPRAARMTIRSTNVGIRARSHKPERSPEIMPRQMLIPSTTSHGRIITSDRPATARAILGRPLVISTTLTQTVNIVSNTRPPHRYV